MDAPIDPARLRPGPAVVGSAEAASLPQRGLRDDELAVVLRHLARLVLEVERGHRSPVAVRQFLSPHLAFDLENVRRPVRARLVASDDIGSAIFQRNGRRGGYGVVVVREVDNSWSALLMTLRRSAGGRWQVVELVRADESTASGSRSGGSRCG